MTSLNGSRGKLLTASDFLSDIAPPALISLISSFHKINGHKKLYLRRSLEDTKKKAGIFFPGPPHQIGFYQSIISTRYDAFSIFLLDFFSGIFFRSPSSRIGLLRPRIASLLIMHLFT